MHIGGNAPLGHLRNDLVGLLAVLAQKAHQVEMTGRGVLRSVMRPHRYLQILEGGIVTLDDLAAAMEQFGIAAQLYQTDGSRNVRHVALEIRSHDVILPSSQLCLGQRILVLPMEGKQLVLLVKPFVIHSGDGPPGDGTALGCREVLHGMEREGGEVCHLATHLAVPLGTESMGGIGQHNDTAKGTLDVIGRMEQAALALHGSKNAVVVAHHTAQIHGHHHLGPFRDGFGHAVVVHGECVGSHINHHNLGTHMVDHTGRGRIGVGRHNHLVAGTYSQHTKRQLHGSRG